MSALVKQKWTEQEYLAFERASETKHEFYRGEIFAMAGATEDHNTIVGNTGATLHSQLRERPCKHYTNDMRVKVPDGGLYAYPDVVVVCGERKFADDRRDMLLNPTLIIKVLSPSTEGYDRGNKFHSYQHLESLQEYVLISQHQARIERFLRQTDGTWIYADAAGLDATIELTSIQCTLALADVYAKVTFEEPPPDETANH